MMDIVLAWLLHLFFLPGKALIAYVGPTPLGRMLDLTAENLGAANFALLCGSLWLLIACGLYYLWGFILDAADPTYRTRRREAAEAERLRNRRLRRI